MNVDEKQTTQWEVRVWKYMGVKTIHRLRGPRTQVELPTMHRRTCQQGLLSWQKHLHETHLTGQGTSSHDTNCPLTRCLRWSGCMHKSFPRSRLPGLTIILCTWTPLAMQNKQSVVKGFLFPPVLVYHTKNKYREEGSTLPCDRDFDQRKQT